MNLYRAVVEDNVSPNKDGRVRVRIFGIHPEKDSTGFESTTTKSLPWAEVLGSTAFGLSEEVGISNVLNIGVWVWVILEQDDQNRPLVIGTITSQEIDFNHLSKIEKIEEPEYDEVSKTDVSDVTQSEPHILDASGKYPEVSTLHTESGHTITIDDTKDNERIRIRHRTGSYFEMRPDGSIILKQGTSGVENHFIAMGDMSTHIKGIVKEYIEGVVNTYFGSDLLSYVNGKTHIHLKEDVTIDIDSNLDVTVKGSTSLTNKGSIIVNNTGNYSLTNGGSITVNNSGGTTYTDGGSYTVTASTINLNQ